MNTRVPEPTPDQRTKIVAAATAEAARLCLRALSVMVRLGVTPSQRARTERYQVEEFSRTSARTERILCDLMRPAPDQPCTCTREELLEAITIYCDAGIVEVRRRFALIS